MREISKKLLAITDLGPSAADALNICVKAKLSQSQLDQLWEAATTEGLRMEDFSSSSHRYLT